MPSFIAISETKLNDRSTINISLEGYVLETKHSPTNAGGVGIYVKENILTSIKKRHKLFKSHFLSNDPEKRQQYKFYNNRLNKIKTNEKNAYFNTQFALNKANIKATWK